MNPLFIRPRQGNLQGDTQAVKTFPLAFNEPIQRWLFQHLDVYATLSNGTVMDFEFCHTKCPQTNKCVDTAHTRYADDVVKTIIGPVPNYQRHTNAEEQALEGLIRRAEASSLLFSKFLGEKGYAQNTDKLVGVIGLNGKGTHKNMRRLQKESSFSYKIADHTKSLGCMVNSSGSFQHERKARIEALAKSKFQLGKRISLKRIPWKLKRTMLIGQVLNVALSGTEAYALRQGDYEILQTAVTKILRTAMGKKAMTLEWNAKENRMDIVKQVPNQCVLRYWNIPTVRTELVVRRLCMYQSMAKNPLDSVLPMAAAFGKMKGEAEHLQDPVVDGYITEDATPWARQFRDDFDYWCEAVEDVDLFFSEYEYRYFNVFLDSQMKDSFLLMDPTILRAWEQSVMIPDTTLSENIMRADQSQTNAQTHHCHLCYASFPTHKQLRIHETTKHNIRCMATLLTPTNGCPNCKTVFATRASAIHHLKNSMKKGYCVGHQAHNLKKLPPRKFAMRILHGTRHGTGHNT